MHIVSPEVLRFMDCRTFRQKHLAFVDDTLPGVDLVRMERHRVECATCARLDTDIRRSLLLIRNNLPAITPSAEFSSRLARRLDEERARQAIPAPLFRGPGLSGFLSMSMGVVALGLLTVALSERSAGTDAPRLAAVEVRPSLVAMGGSVPMPGAPPAFVASVSTGMAIWPALLMMEEAQSRYAADQASAASVRPASYSPARVAQ